MSMSKLPSPNGDELPTSTHQANAKITKRTAEQNAQARLVLIQLLWLAIILMVGAMVWLANNQKKLAMHVEERLKVTQTFATRMNDMDDRLFAMAPSEQKQINSDDVKNDVQLVAIQLTSADRLYQDGDYKASHEILKLLAWQLDSDRLFLAPPIKATLKTAINEDIAQINTLQTQTDPWQADVIVLREVQAYLRVLDDNDSTITPKTLALHDATILLSLAIGAGSMRERETMVVYLTESLAKLEKLKRLSPPSEQTSTSPQTADNDANINHHEAIDGLDKAIFALNRLLANPPNLPPLQSVGVMQAQ